MPFDGDPLQRKTIRRQYLRFPDKCRFSTKSVLTRGIRIVIRALGMHAAGEVRVSGGGVRLCCFNGMTAANHRGNRFTTRKYCCTEPEHGPSHHQTRARESAQGP